MNAGINLLLRWDHVPVVAHNPDTSYVSFAILFSHQLYYATTIGVLNYQQLCENAGA